MALSDYASDRLPEVVAALDADLLDGGRDFNGPCPVHGGDNPTALHLYREGHTRRGNWFCASHHCQEAFGRDLFGFVRGVLSHRVHGWRHGDDRKVSVGETVFWLADLFDVDPAKLCDPAGKARSDDINRWAGRVDKVAGPPARVRPAGWTRERVRSELLIPSPYFLGRGFPAGVLDRYDVGEPLRPRGPMAGRAVVPVYDLPGERVVGFAGRAVADGVSPKWHNEGFASGSTLFNWHFAAPRVRASKTAVLVEGPGDCLRLVAAGVENALAVFGTRLGDAQLILLESLGVMTVVPLFDFDEAGREAVARLRRQIGRSFRIRVPDWAPPDGRKDCGGCTPDELRPLVESL